MRPYFSRKTKQNTEVCLQQCVILCVFVRPAAKKSELSVELPDEKIYLCNMCKKTFRREAALKRHLEYDHQQSELSDDGADQM